MRLDPKVERPDPRTLSRPSLGAANPPPSALGSTRSTRRGPATFDDFSSPRAFSFFSAENISPLGIALDGEFFASRKYLRNVRGAGVVRFSEEKSPSRAFFAAANHLREVVTMLSTQKVTENLQKPPLIYLTGFGAVPISCGQGSGHPHPVVVDNVLGSFGNLVSPEAFSRL